MKQDLTCFYVEWVGAQVILMSTPGHFSLQSEMILCLTKCHKLNNEKDLRPDQELDNNSTSNTTNMMPSLISHHCHSLQIGLTYGQSGGWVGELAGSLVGWLTSTLSGG